jgi:hypothetical protein
MFEVVLYALVSLPFMLVALVLLKRRRRRAALAIALLPLVPYTWVLLNTILLNLVAGGESRQVVSAYMDGNRILTLRCFWINPNYASVYAVTPCSGKDDQRLAVVFRIGFRPVRVVDADDSDVAVWSECGNAHGNTFPPYLDQDHQLWRK